MTLLAGLVLVAAACVPPQASRSPTSRVAATAATRPNIIFFLTDDESSNQMLALPSVRSLIQAQGVTLANAIVPIPLCCPARASLMTGQYDHNNGVLSNHPPTGGYQGLDQTNTLAKWLHDSGYRTAQVGKYMNGYGAAQVRPLGWDEWWAASKHPFLVYDYTLNHNGTEVHYGFASSDYKTDVFTNLASSFVASALPDSGPFYLQLWYTSPHVEQGTDSTGHKFNNTAPRPAPRHVGMYSTAPFPPGDPSFNEADVSDKPAFVRALPPIGPARVASMATKYRTQLASLASVDEGIHKIVDMVTAAGELGNTVFVFASDNGDMHGEHRITFGKEMSYEPSIRVPMFVSGPGFPAGTTVTSPVMFPDYAPTVVQLAGATPGLLMDGTSLQRTIAAPPTDRAILIDSGNDTAPNAKFEGVRTRRWMYASYPATKEAELYDLSQDPFELLSQAKNPAYAAQLVAARNLVTALRACKGAGCNVAVPAVLR